MSSSPPPPSGLTVPPPPPTATMRGAPGQGATQQQPIGVGRNERFAAAKNAPLFNASAPSASGQTSIQRPAASTVPPTPEELGVKFVDANKTDITEEDRAGWKSFRSKVATEVLTTERSYVQSLATMLKAYHDPYFEGQKTGLTDKKVAALFTLVKVLLTVANSFLAEIEVMIKNWDKDELIAPTFIKFYPMFRTYRDYSSTHQQQISVILGKINSRSAFTSFQEKQMRSLMCQDLASYLIMPIQRLPRYKLLLESLISKTESTHPQAPQLLIALKNIGEVATSVNDAMKTAQLVERYMHVQKMFGGAGELVHLWRKLIQEIPCRITRIWSPTTPQKEVTNPKDKKEKREKKHRFVTNDAVLFLFTDCVWLGIKDKAREQKYEETRNTLTPYPLYSNEYSLKFSLLTMGIHNLSTSYFSTPMVINDYTYHNSIILNSPVHAVCVTFENNSVKENAAKSLSGAMHEFEAICRARTLTDSQFLDAPQNGKTSDLLCCDRCQIGLFQYHKLGGGDQNVYNMQHNFVCCTRCQGIVCSGCLHEEAMFEKAAQARNAPQTPAGSKSGGFGMGTLRPSPTPTSPVTDPKAPNKLQQLLGSSSRINSYPSSQPVHSSEGFGVCNATGRWCNACQSKPPQPVAADGSKASANPNHSNNDDRDGLRKSYIGGAGGVGLTQDDLRTIRARQTNKEALTLRIGGQDDIFNRDAALPTPSSRSNEEFNNDNFNSMSHLRTNNTVNSANNNNREVEVSTTRSVPMETSVTRPVPDSPASTNKQNHPPTFRSLDSLSVQTPSTTSTPGLLSSNNNNNNAGGNVVSPTPPSFATSGGPPPFTQRSSCLPPPLPPGLASPNSGNSGNNPNTTSATAPISSPTPPNFATSPPTPIVNTTTNPASPSLPPPIPGQTTPQSKFNTNIPQPPPIHLTGVHTNNQQIDTSDSDLDIPPPPSFNFGSNPVSPRADLSTTSSSTNSSNNILSGFRPPPPLNTELDDDDDLPPPPPTTGEPVAYDPRFVPTTPNSNAAMTPRATPGPPPPPTDDDTVPVVVPVQKQPVVQPTIQRKDVLAPKQARRPSI